MPKTLCPTDLSDEALILIAARFKLLSEPLRLKLLIQLEGGERNVTQLVNAVGTAQANVSRHLRALADAGIVSRRRAGIEVYYSVRDATIFSLCKCVCTSLRQHLDGQARAVTSLRE